MKYYIIAGEASGDIYGGLLIEAIKNEDTRAKFEFWGGDKMSASANQKPYKHFKETAIMGFWEVMTNLRTVLGFISECKSRIKLFKPDVIILIDYPGFNLRIAKWAHENNYAVQYFIAPKVWAWKENRVNAIRQYVDRLYSILPFEPAYFASKGVKAEFYGHPLLEIIDQYESRNTIEIDSNKKTIALLPGSRKQEIVYIFPLMKEYALKNPQYQFLVAQAPHSDKAWFGDNIPTNVQFFQDSNYEIFKIADFAIVASGTATLEAALFDLPQVVVYKGHLISYMIAKQFVKLEYVGLVNLILGKQAIKELLQHEYTYENLTKEMNHIMNPSRQRSIREDYQKLRTMLRPKDSINRIANQIVQSLS